MGKKTGIQKISSQFRPRNKGEKRSKGHEQDIPVDMIEQYEAALTQLPQVKMLIGYALNEFQRKIPGIIDFLMLDKRFKNLTQLMNFKVSDEVSATMRNMLYIKNETDVSKTPLSESIYDQSNEAI